MSCVNTSGNQDIDIKSAEQFGNSVSELSTEIENHISNLVSIISELDDKIEEAKQLLDSNDIPHNL